MAGDIKGITIEIDGNTTKLSRALNQVNSAAKATHKELKQIETALKFNPGNTELLEQKQRALKRAIEDTESSLKKLKVAQEAVAAVEGGKQSKEYDEITRAIIKTESKLKDYQNQLTQLSAKEQAAANASQQRKQRLNELTDAQAHLQRQMQKADNQYELEVAKLGNSASAADKKKAALERLKTQAALTEASIKNLEEAVALAGAEFGEGSSQVNKLEQELEQARVAAQKFKNEYDGLSNKFSDFGSKASNVGQAMMNVGRNASMYVTAPLVGVAVAAGRVGVEFEKQMGRVEAISGATASEFQQLENQAIQLGSSTQFSAIQAAEGMENFASAGFSASEIYAAMPGILDLAAVSGGDVALATENAAAAINAFGLSAADAGHVADVFAQAAADTNAEVADMGNAMAYAAPIANTLGLSIEDTAAAIGVMSDAGIKGTAAGTALRGGLTNLANPSAEAAAKMKELGINVFDASGNMKSMPEVVAELQGGLNGLTAEEKAAALAVIFGKNALSGWSALVEAGSGKLDTLSESFKTADGAAAAMAETMTNNASGSITEMMSALESAGIALFQAMAPTITAVANTVARLAQAFTSASPAVQKFITVIGLIAAAFGPVMMVIGGFLSIVGTISSAIGVVTGGMAAATPAVAGLATVFGVVKAAAIAVAGAIGGLSLPMVAVIAAVVALAVAVATHFDQVKAKAIEIKDALLNAFTGIGETLSAVFSGIAETVSGVFETIGAVVQVGLDLVVNLITLYIDLLLAPWMFIWENFGSQLQSAWETITSIVSGALEALAEIIRSVWDAISSAISAVMGTIQGVITSVWGAISSFIGGVLSAISGAVSSAWSAISSTVSAAMGTVKSVIESGWNAAKSAASSALGSILSEAQAKFDAIKSAVQSKMDAAHQAVTNAINKMKGAFNFSWSLPHLALPHITISGSFSLNPPSAPSFGISWYAQGGIFNAPSVIGVGEAGQEAVLPIEKLDGIMAAALQRAGVATSTGGVSDEKLDKMIALLSALVAKDTNVILDTGAIVGVADRGIAARANMKARGMA